MYITWQTFVTAAAVVTAICALMAYYNKAYKWYQKQEKQDDEIKAIKEEQSILTFGMLACLKGLQEQGCDGPVTKAIDKLETHLNREAHK